MKRAELGTGRENGVERGEGQSGDGFHHRILSSMSAKIDGADLRRSLGRPAPLPSGRGQTSEEMPPKKVK